MTIKAGSGGGMRKRYWRSIERLLDSPAVREQLAATPEFPDGVDQPPDGVTRRTMMTLMGASFALAGATGCRRPVEHIVPYVDAPEGIVPGIPRRYATTFPFAGASYGVVVESHEGRPSKVEGNELHPASLGAASAWAQASILDLFDPDRAPRHQRREKGQTLEAIAWDALAVELAALRASAAEAAGAGLGLLLTGSASPTITRLLARFREDFPQAQVATWEPINDENAIRGAALATGEAARARYHLDRARVVAAFDADLLHCETDHLRHAREFAAARSVADGGEPLRFYAVESSMSVTGANADHRLAVKRAEVATVLAGLAEELARVGIDVPVLDPPMSGTLVSAVRERIRLMAQDLARAGTEGLVAVGRGQPPAVHALALAINQALGALGTTVSLPAVDHPGTSDIASLTDLASAMQRGTLQTLFVLGGNPAYDAPGDLDLASALDKVPTVVHLSTHQNETTAFATHHVAEATCFEAWGDNRSVDGTLSVTQPLIAPLFAGKSVVEILGMLASGTEQSGYERVQETWRSLVEERDFDGAWRRVLHDGVYVPQLEKPPEDGLSATFGPGAAGVAAADPSSDTAADALGGSSPSRSVDPGAVLAALADLQAGTGTSGLEVSFDPSRSVWDGRLANNAWMQELPDPITKIVWDNAALVSPATAGRLGLEAGDVVRLTAGERSIELPVWVLPGQADDSIALELGYGRPHAGRVGTGVGVDVGALRTADGLWAATASLEKTGARYQLVQTQEHWSLEGRPLYRETDVAGYRADPHFAADAHESYEQPFASYDYSKGHQWGMAIDLGSCIGCNACVVACQSENNIPVVGREQVDKGREMHWLRIDRYFGGDLDDPSVAMMPIPCMQCENAPCEQVCPVAATVHDDEGLNAMVYNRCIGTRYCSNNCPYKVRRFNFFSYTKDTPELMKLAMNPDVTVRSRGVMEKCSYCVQRINETKIEAKRAERSLVPNEVKTACQQTCPTNAITFGDLNNAESAVVASKQDNRNYVLLGDLNNRPRTSYLARVGNPNLAWPNAEGTDPGDTETGSSGAGGAG